MLHLTGPLNPPPRLVVLCSIPQPDVDVAGDEVEVTWSLPQQLDIPGKLLGLGSWVLMQTAFAAAPTSPHTRPQTRPCHIWLRLLPPLHAGAVRALRRALRSPAFANVEEGSYGSSVSESSSSGGEGRATTFVRRSRGEAGAGHWGEWRGRGMHLAAHGSCLHAGRSQALAADSWKHWIHARLLPPLLAAAGLGGLTVEVTEPYDASQPARFHFRGRASERDLALMSAALQAAMQPRRRGAVEVGWVVAAEGCAWFRAQQPPAAPVTWSVWIHGAAALLHVQLTRLLQPFQLQEFQEWGSLFEGSPFGRGLEGAVDPFFEHLQEFIRGFERMAQGE